MTCSYDDFSAAPEEAHVRVEEAAKTLKGKPVEEVIKTLCDLWFEAYGLKPDEINHGCCDIFAIDLRNGLDGAEKLWDDEIGGRGEHCFVRWKGRYYDSACPEGADHWRHLPFYGD